MAHNVGDTKRTRPVSVLLSVLWGYISRFKKELVQVSALVLLYTIVATFQPIALQQAINYLLTDPSSNRLSLLFGIFLTLSVLVWVFQSLNIWVMSSLSASMVQDIRNDSFESLVYADMAYHHKHQSGNITARVVSDTQEIANGLTLFTNSATELLLVVTTLIVLTYINVIFLVIALLGVPIAFLISKIFGKILRERGLKARQAFGHVSGKLAENLTGIGISKSFKQEERMSDEFGKYNNIVYDRVKKLVIISLFIPPSLAFISTLLVYAVLVSGGYLFSLNSANINFLGIGFRLPSGSDMSIDVIFLGTILIQRFLSPISNLTQNYTQLQTSLGSLDRVTDVLSFQNNIYEQENAQPLDVQNGSIEFEDVHFSYIEDQEVLKGLSFSINPGEKIALVGQTGAGKSTIGNLLMRFYDPISGSIRIDGQDLREVNISSIQSNIGLVTQDPYIFAGSIMDNIRYGKPEARDDEVYDVCRLIGADEFIEVLPEAYNTLVQESGKSLSAGQRQMITIARVFLAQPKIIILDEATSRLDAYTEAMVQHAHLKLFEGRTTIIIAHRLSTIQEVNRIIVLDYGSISSIGTHEQLIASNEIYQELYNLYYGNLEILT